MKGAWCYMGLLVALSSARATPFGWGAGSGGGGGGGQGGYNPAASSSGDSYWWMNENPFQKPANHPGVEKTAPTSGGAGWSGPTSGGSKPAYGSSGPSGGQRPGCGGPGGCGGSSSSSYGPSGPAAGCGGGSGGCSGSSSGSYGSVAAPQVQPARPSGGSYAPAPAPQVQPARPSVGSYGPAPVPAAGPSGGSYGGSSAGGAGWSGPGPAPSASVPLPNQGYKPPSINFECMLTNKADCHGASEPSYNQVDSQISSSYNQVKPGPSVPSYGGPAPVSSGGSYAPAAPAAPKPSYVSSSSSSYQPAAPQTPSYSPGPSNNIVPTGPKPVSKPAGGSYTPGPSGPAPGGNGWSATASSGSGYQPAPAPAPKPSYQPAPAPQPSYQPAPAPQPSYQPAPAPAPQPSYQPAPAPAPKPSYQPAPQPSYQPAPQPSYQPSYQPAPEGGNYGPQPPYPGCPAALLCVPENQCDANGVAQGRPLPLTEADKAYRVALMRCSAAETGAVGVCCRDPNYKDPWPDMNGGGGGQHHHHEGGSGAAGSYADAGERDKSSGAESLKGSACPLTSICVPTYRCVNGQLLNHRDEIGQMEALEQPLSEKCRQGLSNQTYTCCAISDADKRREGLQSFQQNSDLGEQSSPLEMAQKTGSNDVNQYEEFIFENKSNFQVQISTPAPTTEVTAPNSGSALVTTVSVSSQTLAQSTLAAPQLAPATALPMKQLDIATSDQGTTVTDEDKEIDSPPIVRVTPTSVPVSRKPKQRIRVKLVTRIGDQPNVVALPPATSNTNAVQISSNYRFSPVQSVFVANVPKGDEAPRLSSFDGELETQTVIDRPSHRVVITDLRLPQQQRQFPQAPQVFTYSQGNKIGVTEVSTVATTLPITETSVRTVSQTTPLDISFQPEIAQVTSQVQNTVAPQRQVSPDKPSSPLFEEASLVLELHQSSVASAFESTSTTTSIPETPTSLNKTNRRDQFHLYPFLPAFQRRRELLVTELGETVQVPSQNYELPELLPEDQLRFIAPPHLNSDLDEITFFSPLAQSSANYIEECPENMKCLTEAYCSTQNPEEGDSKDFDIRLQSGKRSTRKKCRQPHLPVDGYCCYLREDFESIPQHSETSENQRKVGKEDSSDSITCGIRRPQTTDQGEGDEGTSFGEFPWQALIFINGQPSCGGAILSERIVATSASCINVVRLQEITIRVGDWDVSNILEVKPHQDLFAKEFIPFPGYKPGLLSDDFALLVTKTPIRFDYHIAPICLPNPIDHFEDQRCIATGWSVPLTPNADQLEFGYRLKKAQLTLVDRSKCQETLQQTALGLNFTLTRGTICGEKQPTSGACLGDHGGPLICENRATGTYTLAGVSTSSRVCQTSKGTSVYSNLPSYVEWTYNILERPIQDGSDSDSELKF